MNTVSRWEWTVRCAVRKRLILFAKKYGVRSDNKSRRIQTTKKGENIFKRKDGRWEARYIKGYNLSGEIKYGYCCGRRYQEAKEKVAKFKEALLAGKPTLQTGTRHRFAFYCDSWLQKLKRAFGNLPISSTISECALTSTLPVPGLQTLQP